MARTKVITRVLMLLLSFLAMYVLMYAMVDVLGNALPNLNQFYMAGMMVAPMAVIELLVMGAMYKNKKLNAGLMVVSLIALVGFWQGIRQQVAIGDRQFLKSMIPQHSGAILMCEQAAIRRRGTPIAVPGYRREPASGN